MHHLRPLLYQVDLSVDLDSRIGIIGRNGCGKTTLIKVCLLITVGPIQLHTAFGTARKQYRSSLFFCTVFVLFARHMRR